MSKARADGEVIIGAVIVAGVAGVLIWVLAHDRSTPIISSPQTETSSSYSYDYDRDAGIQDSMGGPSPEAVGNTHDPYATAGVQQNIKGYIALRHEVLARVKYLYFAANCGVLFTTTVSIGEFNAERAIQPRAAGLNDLALQIGIADNEGMSLMRIAAQAGRGAAKLPHACQYWQDHPEDVADVRNEVQAAVR